MLLYLDNCCFNRPFDDLSQARIRLEAAAVLKIQEDIRNGLHGLAWSYILDYENHRSPMRERRERIERWRSRSCAYAGKSEEIIQLGVSIEFLRIIDPVGFIKEVQHASLMQK